MTREDLAGHVDNRLRTPQGLIARRTTEMHGGRKGSTIVDVRPAALAMIRATHGRGCACDYCS